MEPWWLDVDPYFKPVIDLHDAFETSGGFDKWRLKFIKWSSDATGTGSLPRFLTDNFADVFPSSGYTEQEIAEAFINFDKPLGKTANLDNFNTWRGWFSGYWKSDGSYEAKNFHIWDRTVPLDAGRYIQPVTQSNSDFYYSVNDKGERKKGEKLEKAVTDKKVDLAIDIADTRHGLTGWVQKYQQNPTQLWPHVGILLDTTHLFWFAQNLDDKLVPKDGENVWFVFFEYGDRSDGARTYQVRGKMMKIDDKSGVSLYGSADYYGRLRYYCFPPYSATRILTKPECPGTIPYK